MDAKKALYSRKWDVVIAHPPCTRLANSGVRWLSSRKPKAGYEWDEQRKIYITTDNNLIQDLFKGAKFVNDLLLYGKLSNKICVEQPVHHKYAKQLVSATHSQIVQPWMFGHKKMKATCFYLYGLPLLKSTNIVGAAAEK